MEQIDRNTMQIIRMNEVSKLSGLSRSTLYEKLNEKSSRYDKTFPKQLKLSRNAVGWLEHEVLEWLESKANERFS
ncbi:helix-turn-helix transcriptional regulator [Acinetobacter baumannii]|uniref:helix-turn-helix transcriptional regulator n=1 Tax=Acinetobacter baumannii TaxID=470 RepID=UPI003891AAC8